MKKLISIILLSMLCVVLVACGDDVSMAGFTVVGDDKSNEQGNMQIANPWSDCKTIAEAEEIAGFPFESIKGAEINGVRVMQGENFNIIEAFFYDGENKITIRKGNTTEDISGDYTAYAVRVMVHAVEVGLEYSGSKEGMCSLVTWQKDGYSYSIRAAEETKKEYMESYVNVVFE